MSENPWKPGDLVGPKSSGPNMTVVGDDGGGRVLCEWYDGKPMTGAFSAVALEARLSPAEGYRRMAEDLRQQPRRRY